jgi:hypothetical protein
MEQILPHAVPHLEAAAATAASRYKRLTIVPKYCAQKGYLRSYGRKTELRADVWSSVC